MSKNYNSTLQSNNTDLQEIIDALNELPDAGGIELPELSNEGTASDLLAGKQLIDSEGNIIEGTIPTVEPVTYITVSGNSGLITANVALSKGYATGGIKATTYQLVTEEAKTITPSTSSQVAVAQGRYTIGDITVAPIPESYIEPSGTKTITTNGTHDVKAYASATVNVSGEDVTDETTEYTNKLATLETAITQLETELAGKASGGSSNNNIEMCTVTFNNNNSSYTSILFIQYTTISETGEVVGKTLVGTPLSNSFSIQCICNTCIAGIFPPTNISLVEYTNVTQNLSANSSNGAFFWGTLTSLPNETTTFTFN